MKLLNFFKKDNFMFYSDSLEILINSKRILEECRTILSKSNSNTDIEKLIAPLKLITDSIDNFLNNWKSDGDKICSTLATANDYIKYYSKLCKRINENNYKEIARYVIDSIDTVLLVLASKINYINKEKLIKSKSLT
jgi:hypothetical protein